MNSTSHLSIFEKFSDFLFSRQSEAVEDFDIRQYVLEKSNEKSIFGYVGATLAAGYGENLPKIFPNFSSVDTGWDREHTHAFLSGTVSSDESKSHKGATRLLERLNGTEKLILFEQGFLATAHSWAEAFKSQKEEHACLGFVYDDISHYFMADYPNRLINRLNSDEELTEKMLSYSHSLIETIVQRKVSKYNAQPFVTPKFSERFERRVLVCDQAFADASTVFGKLKETDFERMLLTAITENPDAEIVVKSHPDTSWRPEDRKGYYSHLKDTGRVRIIREPINPFCLFDIVDTVYIGSSQMGLEALFAGKKVVCFGAPFYAGWGLTDDRLHIPHRRRSRSLEEIFYYFYIWYTIYHVPGCAVPSTIEDALDFIEEHRPFLPPPNPAEVSAPPKVSVVIPIHNVENYLEHCLRSVQIQSLREIEIIPVNDQSPDGCQEIIDRLATQDRRIRPILMKENVGQGFARNAGIAAARGEYVWFLDADDYFAHKDVLKSAVEVAERNSSDMVRTKKARERVEDQAGKHVCDRLDGSELLFLETRDSVDFSADELLLQNRHFWNWLYRREFLEDSQLRFVNTQWEERPFLLAALLAAKSIAQTQIESVVYRVRLSSTARRKKTDDDAKLLVQNFSEVVRLLSEAGAFESDNVLRKHADFLLSQYLQYLFIGFPYQVVTSKTSKLSLTWLVDQVANAYEEARFGVGQFDRRPVTFSKRHLGAGAFELLILGIQRRDTALVRRAVDLEPFTQKQLRALQLQVPVSPEDGALQDAVNTFARNDRVKSSNLALRKRVERPRLILHIGASKTGSTALQHTLEMNRPKLLRNGIWYPEVGLFWQEGRPHKQAGHALFTPAAVNSKDYLKKYLYSGSQTLGGKINTIILSSEAFFLQQQSHKIANYLSDFPCEVIFYVRRQDEWVNSQYCEYVGGGAVGRVSEPIDEWVETLKIQSLMDYRTTLERFSKVVPKDMIKVRVFEKSQLVDGDVIADFAVATDLPMLNELPRINTKLKNEAHLSNAHLRELAPLNAYEYPSQDSYFSFIDDVQARVTMWRETNSRPIHLPMMLDAEKRRLLVSRFAESNEQIAREWLNRTDGKLFSDEIKHVETGDKDCHPDEIAIIHTAYKRWTTPRTFRSYRGTWSTSRRSQRTDAGRRNPASRKIVSYGIFGWRKWVLTPFVRSQVRKIGTEEDLLRFDRDPSTFMHSLNSPHYLALARWLYPTGNIGKIDGSKMLRVRAISPFVKVLGDAEDLRILKHNPVLFFRILRNPLYRAAGRALFPTGEAIEDRSNF